MAALKENMCSLEEHIQKHAILHLLWKLTLLNLVSFNKDFLVLQLTFCSCRSLCGLVICLHVTSS